MLEAFLDDGYTENGLIDEAPGLHPEVSFTFRPMTLDERALYKKRVQGLGDAKISMEAADWLAKKIKSWSLPEERLNQAGVLKLKPRLFNRLFGVVFGDVGHDARESDRNT